MITDAINQLSKVVQFAPAILSEVSEEIMSEKPAADKWSKKEILGHLIDSATNNHQRFVRGQFELNPEIGYHTDNWVKFSHYQEIDSQHLISFWTLYNKQLLEIIKRIPDESLEKSIKVNETLYSLAFLIEDYIRHLEHHLKQIINYSE